MPVRGPGPTPSLHDATRGRILFGGDYNPEQWPEEVWEQDVRLMQHAGVNSATVGVFSWARIEPRPGVREFGWLTGWRTAARARHRDGAGHTDGASPPPWMGARHPDTLPRDEDGRTVWWGRGSSSAPAPPRTGRTRRRSPRTWPPGTPGIRC